MEKLEQNEKQSAAKRRERTPREGGLRFWDGLSILLLVGAVMVAVVALMIVLNPLTSLNPYPPPTRVPTMFVPTYTATQRKMPVTWTPTPAPSETPTPTPLPPTETPTPTATETGTLAPPTETIPASAYPWLVRGTPAVIAGDVIHPGEGCKLWVAGQTFSMNGEPQTGMIVQMGGTLERKTVYLLGLTGTVLQYGPAGYEFLLSEQAVDSMDAVWIQLLDQESKPLSNRVYFQTYADCEKNLILINFKQVR